MDSSTDSSRPGSDSEDDVQECGDGNSNAMSKIDTNLSERSREKYLKAYAFFKQWKISKGYQFYTEDVFLEYFKELGKTKQASTLWAVFSMLRATVYAHHGVQIKTFSKLTSYLKAQAKGHVIKKSKVFTAQEVETFLKDAPDEFYLAIKVALVFGLFGACRALELIKLKTRDIEKHSDQLILVNIMKTPKLIERSFIIRDEYVKLVEKYQALRPKQTEIDRFFIKYSNGKCTRQAIGRNTITLFPRKIAAFLNLPNPDLYTGHCFRHTAGILGWAQTGANLMVRQSRRSNTIGEESLAQSATMRLRSADPDWRLKSARTLRKSSNKTKYESPNEAPYESPNETQHSETSVNETQFDNIPRLESLDETQQVKLEWSDCQADESQSVKSDKQFDHIHEDYVMHISPLPRSPNPRRGPPLHSLRQLAALERRRLRLDEVRARQLHARESRRLSVEARRIEVDREKNEVLRRIADVAFALLEKAIGNGVIRH